MRDGGVRAGSAAGQASLGGSDGLAASAAADPRHRPLIALFDYGAGNLHSLGKALEGAGASVRVTRDWSEAVSLEALVLPGVGAFGAAAAALPADRAVVRDALEAGLPCLGICLGMQLLFERSDESAGDGIGLVPGEVRVLDAPIVPQMGWNDVDTSPDPIFDGIQGLVAYYANSYVCAPTHPADAIAWSEYGGARFAAGVRRGNAWGLQFHPEKSSSAGRRIIENFVGMVRGGGGSVADDERREPLGSEGRGRAERGRTAGELLGTADRPARGSGR